MNKGEETDYAIVHDEKVQMLVAGQHVGAPFELEHASQSFRYFAVTNARIVIRTDGEVYHFCTDLDVPNKVDAKPFLVLAPADIDATLIPELQKLSKEVFDLDSIICAAGEPKFIGAIERAIAAEFEEPDVERVKFFTTEVCVGAFTQKVCEQSTPLVAKAVQQYLNEQVNRSWRPSRSSGRSSAARSSRSAWPAAMPSPAERSCSTTTTASPSHGCTSTPGRSTSVDFDEDKKESRHPIDALEDIFQSSDQLRSAVEGFVGATVK